MASLGGLWLLFWLVRALWRSWCLLRCLLECGKNTISSSQMLSSKRGRRMLGVCLPQWEEAPSIPGWEMYWPGNTLTTFWLYFLLSPCTRNSCCLVKSSKCIVEAKRKFLNAIMPNQRSWRSREGMLKRCPSTGLNADSAQSEETFRTKPGWTWSWRSLINPK